MHSYTIDLQSTKNFKLCSTTQQMASLVDFIFKPLKSKILTFLCFPFFQSSQPPNVIQVKEYSPAAAEDDDQDQVVPQKSGWF
jgi:hypothetical protein